MTDSAEPKTIKLTQAAETPLTTALTPTGSVLYMYARSNDSVHAETIGQDYVTFRYDEQNVVFAVCDGVGQSFMGDLAARILGDGLIDWLWTANRPADEKAFQEAVQTALDKLTETSGPAVENYKLPDSIPPLLAAALNMQRDYGSESMFVAGRVALGASEPWVGLCWLGDSPVAAVDYDGELVDLGPRGHTSERWNATTGVKGTVHTWVGDAKSVARVAGYTDGLGVTQVPTDSDLARLMEIWRDDPPSDDASLVDVRLAPSPKTLEGDRPDEEDERKMAALVRKSKSRIVTREQVKAAVEEEEADEQPEPAQANEPPEEAEAAPTAEYATDDSRPLPKLGDQKSPVSDVKKIEAKDSGPATGEWRPLTAKPAEKKDEEKPAKTLVPAMPVTEDLVKQVVEIAGKEPSEQVAMWQQAALLGLTSAALAMLMMERLVEDIVETDDEEQ